MCFPFWEHMHFPKEITFRNLLRPLKTGRHGILALGSLVDCNRSQINKSTHVANDCALEVGNFGIVGLHLATKVVPIHCLHFKEKFKKLDLPFLDDSLSWRVQSVEQFVHHVSEERYLHVSFDFGIESSRLQSDSAQTKY